MPRPSNGPKKLAVIVGASVVAVVALGIITNQLSDALGAALADKPHWYLTALAGLVVIGIAAAYLYEASHREPAEPPRPTVSKPGPDTLRRIRMARRAALGALLAGGVVAGTFWRKNFVDLVEYGYWAPPWTSVDRREFSGSFASFSHDGSKIIVLSEGLDAVAVHEIETGTEHWFTWDGDFLVEAAALERNGVRLAGARGGGGAYEDTASIVLIWDFESKRLIDELQVAVGWFVGGLIFHPDRPELLINLSQWDSEAGDFIYRLDLWDIDRGEQIASVSLPDLPHHMELSPDAGIAAVSCLDHRVHLFDAATLESVGVLAPPDYGDSLAFTPDSKTLAVGGTEPGDADDEQATVSVWDLESLSQTESRAAGAGLWASAVAMHPKGGEIAMGTGSAAEEGSGSDDVTRRLMFWSLAQDEPVAAMDVGAKTVLALRYKEEGDILEGLMALDEGMAWQRWQRAG
jgi:hypothetical protein